MTAEPRISVSLTAEEIAVIVSALRRVDSDDEKQAMAEMRLADAIEKGEAR